VVLKSSPKVQWSPFKPMGLPKGRYQAALSALANSMLPAHTSIGVDPLLYVGGQCCPG